MYYAGLSISVCVCVFGKMCHKLLWESAKCLKTQYRNK